MYNRLLVVSDNGLLLLIRCPMRKGLGSYASLAERRRPLGYPPVRRRFRQRAAEADLKLNELLREALNAWEQRRGLL